MGQMGHRIKTLMARYQNDIGPFFIPTRLSKFDFCFQNQNGYHLYQT